MDGGNGVFLRVTCISVTKTVKEDKSGDVIYTARLRGSGEGDNTAWNVGGSPIVIATEEDLFQAGYCYDLFITSVPRACPLK